MIEVVLNTTLRLLRESYDRVCIEYYTEAHRETVMIEGVLHTTLRLIEKHL